MPTGHMTAFFQFDVADGIDLPRVRELVEATVATRLSTKAPTPTYLQYQQPPLTFDGSVIGPSGVDGCRARAKAFDYGLISVALTQQLPDSWERILPAGLEWQEDPRLADAADRLCRQILERISPAVDRPRTTFLSEDYFVFTVLNEPTGATSDELLAAHGTHIAQLLRGERERLSAQEREEILRHRISYYDTDLVVPTWSSAFVYDTDTGATGVLEILEFTNSQLLEFRYYDQLLDAELSKIYSGLQRGWKWPGVGRRYTRAARQVHTLFIDVNELTDRAENALKIAGDVYAARVFGATAARIGLDQWKANVREKLRTVDDIYRFAVERSAIARGEFLELTIVILILLEMILLVN
jgi:hypothetical protein